ncbi:MAG: sigma-70 family RNA polymerase sigma factor [Victivallales bacterium]|nr:sigma-70 family RNA polymerase sigma factor [Victivallales bacterium]
MSYNISETRFSMIDGALHRNESQWERFYVKYRRLVIYLGKCLRLSDLDIEELTSRVMVKFSKQEGRFQYDPDKQFRSYFARMVHSTAMDLFREKKRLNSQLAEWPVDDEGRPMEFGDPKDLESALLEHDVNEIYAMAKEKLQIDTASAPEKYRCWQLNREEGWPIKKIVEYLDLPQSTVYWNIGEITQQLARICGELLQETPPLEKQKKPSAEKSSVKHINQGEILQYIYNECGLLTRRRIAEHLKKCPECSALEAELRTQLELQAKLVAGAQKYTEDAVEVNTTISRFQRPLAPVPPKPPQFVEDTSISPGATGE